jgi:hypothetical protein
MIIIMFIPIMEHCKISGTLLKRPIKEEYMSSSTWSLTTAAGETYGLRKH